MLIVVRLWRVRSRCLVLYIRTVVVEGVETEGRGIRAYIYFPISKLRAPYRYINNTCQASRKQEDGAHGL